MCVLPCRRMSGLNASVSYLFEGHPLVLQHLVPALLNLYTGMCVCVGVGVGALCSTAAGVTKYCCYSMVGEGPALGEPDQHLTLNVQAL
jgi:hypothetical protein